MTVLNILARYRYEVDSILGLVCYVDILPANEGLETLPSGVFNQQFLVGPFDPDNNYFPTAESYVTYVYGPTTYGAQLLNDANTAFGSGSFTLGTISYVPQKIQDALAGKQNNLPTGASSSQYLGGDLTFHNIPAAMARIQNAVTLTFGSGSQPSTTRDVLGVYSVSIADTLSLSGGAAGYVSLEIATNSGFTSGLQEVARVSNSNTGSLTIGLNLNDTSGGVLTGYIPAGYYRRLSTHNTTGTPTYTYVCGQEIQL